MSSSLEIETTLIADFQLRLTADAELTSYIEDADRGDDVVFPAVSVGVLDLSPALIDGQGQPPGWHRAVILLDCQSYIADDPTGVTLRGLAKSIRALFVIDDIVTTMNTLSSYNTYYSIRSDPGASDTEENIRHLPMTFTVIMRPSNEKTTTTTTTTT